MKLTFLSAFLFILLASAQGWSIRNNHNQPQDLTNNNHYVITAPKIFLGEESVCLTLFDWDKMSEGAKLKVQLRSNEGTTIFETEEDMTSGE